MSKTDNIHQQIYTRFHVRVVAQGIEGAILVSDVTRKVMTLKVEGRIERVVWWQNILDALARGEQPLPSTLEYRQYAR